MTKTWDFVNCLGEKSYYLKFFPFRDCANVTIAPEYVRIGFSETCNKHWYTFFIKITIERDY
jgi:hypothetical protein